MNTILKLAITISLFFGFGYTIAEQLPVVITQKDKLFSEEEVTVKLGDSVEFTNEDPFFHNIFSLSTAATFDLGSFPEGESRKVTFEKPGEVIVECAIHPSMQMTIEVVE